MTNQSRPRAALVCAAACLVTGCQGLPEIGSVNAIGVRERVVGSPTDVYTRIARGAMTCWFGTAGPLRDAYIFQAEAEPASRGGRSKIVVRVRDREAASPRGLKAFSVTITPEKETVEIAVVNHKLPEPLGKTLEADVRRWSVGEVGCQGTGTWAEPDAPDKPPAAGPAKPKAVAKKARKS